MVATEKEERLPADIKKARQSLQVQTQFLIFTLMGEYVAPRGGTIWTASLLELMELLHVSERAVRSTLSRMRRKNWVTSERVGRMSKYRLTARGRAALQRGEKRIFEPVFTDWDQTWQLVVYSLPEEKRRRRHVLRKQLNWLGFGHLAPGTWCSPHDRRPELEELFANLRVEEYVDLFCGVFQGPSSARELVERCWDLAAIGAQYRKFIAKHEADYETCLRSMESGELLDPKLCFIRRFQLAHDFTSLPHTDPNLPVELLPAGWIGLQGRRFFNDYHGILSARANAFVDEVLDCVED